MAEADARREGAFRRWLSAASAGGRLPSPAAWRDAAAVFAALRSGVRDADELERVTGLRGRRCLRAQRLVEAVLRFDREGRQPWAGRRRRRGGRGRATSAAGGAAGE